MGVGKTWNNSLIVNQSSLLSENLIGTSIFNHVSGDSTQIWLGALLQKAKVSGLSERSYRCDSPEEKRWCKVIIQHRAKHTIMTHQTLKTLSITQDTVSKHSSHHYREKIYRVCSVCCKVSYKGTFIDPVDFCILEKCSMNHLYSHTNKTVYVICNECAHGH